MHNFKVDERFDVIFSVFDAMNELKDFDQWKSTFNAVNDHLYRDGLYIFDVFTPKILRNASSLSTAKAFSKGYYFDKADSEEQQSDLGRENL
jgi:hypothetical protein